MPMYWDLPTDPDLEPAPEPRQVRAVHVPASAIRLATDPAQAGGRAVIVPVKGHGDPMTARRRNATSQPTTTGRRPVRRPATPSTAKAVLDVIDRALTVLPREERKALWDVLAAEAIQMLHHGAYSPRRLPSRDARRRRRC